MKPQRALGGWLYNACTVLHWLPFRPEGLEGPFMRYEFKNSHLPHQRFSNFNIFGGKRTYNLAGLLKARQRTPLATFE